MGDGDRFLEAGRLGIDVRPVDDVRNRVGVVGQPFIDADAPGHPIFDLADFPVGTYHVQAVLNVYETFERADGHTVKLPADNGEGQHWNRSPGNLYSQPVEVTRC